LSTAILFNAELYVDQLGQVSAIVSRWMGWHKHTVDASQDKWQRTSL